MSPGLTDARSGHGRGCGSGGQHDASREAQGVQGALPAVLVLPPALGLTRTRCAQSGKVGEVAQELYNALTDLQSERAPDSLGWLLPVDV